MQALCLQELFFLLETSAAFFQLGLDGFYGAQELVSRLDIVRFGIDGEPVVLLEFAARKRIDLRDAVDFVAEEFDPDRVILVGRKDLHNIPPDPEETAFQRVILPGELHLHQAAQDVLALETLSLFEKQEHAVICLGRAQAVNARYAGNDDAIPPLEQRARSRVAQAVDFIVDQRVLFDVGVCRGDIGLRLVVVVIGDKVLDRIMRKESFEFPVKLRREGLVVRQDERRPLHGLDHLRHGERFPGAGNTEQHLVLFAVLEAAHQLLNGRRLVSTRLEGGAHFELG